MMKKILIGIPTARYIEVETFKAIYDLEVPEGYEAELQIFKSDQVDQVRNLIASWVVNQYDYLFAVDHDIVFPPDTLKKLLAHNVSIATGIYRQRKEEQILEIYDMNMRNMPYEALHEKGLVEIGACGFGCVLVTKAAFVDVGYPQFVYHDALDHSQTFSEDLDFLVKARQKGHTVWCDTSILCTHIGSRHFNIEVPVATPQTDVVVQDNVNITPLQALAQIASEVHLPEEHREYLKKLGHDTFPCVIYDIGSNVLDWTRAAIPVWPDATYIAFEAMDEVEPLYTTLPHKPDKYFLGVLSDKDGREVDFYQNPYLPWGSSYYKENETLSNYAYNTSHIVKKKTRSLDSLIREHKLPWPDLIKIDVQGAELDVLKGAICALQHCNDIIIELQSDEYNIGAPLKDEVVSFLDDLGFTLEATIHLNDHDGDYHFVKMYEPGQKVDKIYVIEIDDPVSRTLAERTHKSISNTQNRYTTSRYMGVQGLTKAEIFEKYGVRFGGGVDDKAACATMSHYLLWQQIYRNKETAIILEHDSIMLQNMSDAIIPNHMIIALGFKCEPKDTPKVKTDKVVHSVIPRKRHSGAHAYAITWKTAKRLLDELDAKGSERAIDNFYFMRVNQEGDTESNIPLGLMVPCPVICVPGKSTIWNFESSLLNYDVENINSYYGDGFGWLN